MWNKTHEWEFSADTEVTSGRGVLDNLHRSSLVGRVWRGRGPQPDALVWSQMVQKQVEGAGLVEEAGETRGKFSLEWPRHLYHKHRMVFGCQEICDSCALLDTSYPRHIRLVHEGYIKARVANPELWDTKCPTCQTCPEVPKITVKCGAATEFTVEPSADADVQLNIPVRLVLGSRKRVKDADEETRVAKIFYNQKSSFHFYTWAF